MVLRLVLRRRMYSAGVSVGNIRMIQLELNRTGVASATSPSCAIGQQECGKLFWRVREVLRKMQLRMNYGVSAAGSGSAASRFNHRSRRARSSCSMETIAKPMPRPATKFRTMARTRTSPSGVLKSNCRLVPIAGESFVHTNKPPSARFSTREMCFSVPFFQATRTGF